MKVWTVTSGRYSDYTIEGVFSSLEQANVFLERKGNQWGEVREWEVDARIGEVKRKVYVVFLPDGRENSYEVLAPPTARVHHEHGIRGPEKGADGRWYATARSFMSFEHARKLAEEDIQAEIRKQVEGKPDAHLS